MRTFVYRNLQNGLWSIQQKVDGRMTVVGHARHVELANPRPKHNEAMRQRIIQNKRRKVCTMCEGTALLHVEGLEQFKGRPIQIAGERAPECARKVTFNPYVDATLVYDRVGSGLEFTAADYAVFTSTHQMMVNR